MAPIHPNPEAPVAEREVDERATALREAEQRVARALDGLTREFDVVEFLEEVAALVDWNKDTSAVQLPKLMGMAINTLMDRYRQQDRTKLFDTLKELTAARIAHRDASEAFIRSLRGTVAP